MRKHVFGRQFKRDANERKSLFKGLASSLVLEERITTTEEKAKAIRPYVEKLVTKSRKSRLQAQTLLQPYLNAKALKKMLADVGPRFAERNGGYTRIVRVGNRLSDNATMVVMEWVEKGERVKAQSEKAGKKAVKKATDEKRSEANVTAAKPEKKEVKKEAKAKTEKPKQAVRAKGSKKEDKKEKTK